MLLRRNETTDLFIFCDSILLQAVEEHYKTCMGFQPTLNPRPCAKPQEFNFEIFFSYHLFSVSPVAYILSHVQITVVSPGKLLLFLAHEG